MLTTRPELLGTHGMVASTHWLASATGMAAMDAGGNAFDAAVAAGLVLQVVEPHLNGPGGEVPVVFSTADGVVRVMAGQGPAPAAATITRFRDLGLDLVPGTGLLPACVPAAFDTWMRLLAEHGRLPLRQVMEPAIGYAGRGFPLVPGVCAAIASVAEHFRAEWSTCAELYLPGGEAPAAGTLFRNRRLAETYRRVLDTAEAAGAGRDRQIQAARDAWYRGFVAEEIDRYIGGAEVADVSGHRHRGLLRGDDLAAFATPVEPPVTFDYRGYTVCKTGPWGQGPVLLQQLALLEGLDPGVGPDSAEWVHTVVECAKLAFADREAWYGDPAFVDVPVDALLAAGYNDTRRGLVSGQASFELRPGAPAGRTPRLPPAVPVPPGRAGTGEPTMEPSPAHGPAEGDTCHLDVADGEGNLVSATPSGGWLQSSPVIPGLGFCLGTRAQMFWLVEDLPNSLAPGKRPRTTLTPSLALREGEPYLAFGTPGGDQQDQWSLLLFLRHVDFGANLQEAIDAPAFHTTHFPSSFYPRDAHPGRVVVEDRLPRRVLDGLRARGHEVVVVDGWSLGRLSAAGREPARGLLKAAANPRGMQGYAVGR